MPDDAASPIPEAVSPVCHCQSLRQAARRATALYDAAMAPFGLRISQFAILARLRHAGPMNLNRLAAVLVLDRTTLGRNLRALERDGLVGSEADPADKRVRRLLLTDAGAMALRRAGPAWRAAQAAYEAQLGTEPAVALRAELHRTVAALRPSEPESPVED